jgi:hypothetical protein
MRNLAVAAVLTALAVIPGCTSITNIHNYGEGKPTVVHDTVYVEHGPDGVLIPDSSTTVTPPVPGEEGAPLTGRVSWIEELDPGTAMVETVIDYDLGITSHRMIGNLLSESGLRFELNVMVISGGARGAVEYYLIPEFISSRDWNAGSPEPSLQGSGRISPGAVSGTDPTSRENSSTERSSSTKEVSGRPSATSTQTVTDPSGLADLEAVIIPSLLIRLDGVPYVLDDMDDFDCEAHTTMLYGVTVRIPVSAAMIESLASGVLGSIEVRDLGGSVTGLLTEDNFTNFHTFVREYM